MAEELQEESLMDSVKIEEVTTEEENNTEEKNPMAHAEAKTDELSPEEIEDLERPDFIPEKFWDAKEGPDLEALSKSYIDLEKKFSQGKHKVPEKYDTSAFEDSNIDADDPVMKVYTDWAKDAKISQANFESLVQKVADLNGGSEDTTISVQEEKQKLGPNADEIIKSNAEWGRGLVRNGVLSETDYEQLTVLGGTAEGHLTMRKLRTLAGEKDIPIKSTPMLGDETPEDLHEMVQSEKYHNDPAYRKSVEKKFQKMFNG